MPPSGHERPSPAEGGGLYIRTASFMPSPPRPPWNSTASSPSSPTPPSTTPPAPRAAPTKRDSLGGRGIGSTEGSGICHSYAPDGRCISLLKILLTNFCIYDCLYCVNRVSSNVPRARFTRRRGGAADARLLPPQLHRGPVPQLRHHPLARLHDGAAGRGRADAARGARLPRLHPPEDDPRGQRRSCSRAPAAMPTGSASTSSCRRAALARWRPRRTARRSAARWRACASTSTSEGGARGRQPVASQPTLPPKRARPPRFAPAGQSTQMIVGADAADDRAILATSAHALRRLPAAARLLLGVQPDPRRRARAAAERAAAAARAPPLPGRLADALLRLRATTRSSPAPRRHAGARHRPEAGLGAGPPRALPGRPEPRAARRCCCACRASASRRSSGCCRRAACARCAPTTWSGCACRCAKVLPFVVARRPPAGAALDAPTCAAACARRPPRQLAVRLMPDAAASPAGRARKLAAMAADAALPRRPCRAGDRATRRARSRSRARSTSTASGAPAARSGPSRWRPSASAGTGRRRRGRPVRRRPRRRRDRRSPAPAAGQRAGRVPAALPRAWSCTATRPLRPALPAALAAAGRARRCAHDPLDPDWLRRRRDGAGGAARDAQDAGLRPLPARRRAATSAARRSRRLVRARAPRPRGAAPFFARRFAQCAGRS